jgi:hypothetical protein
MAKAAPKKAPTKTQVYASIAEVTGLGKKEVAAVFDALAEEVKKSMSSRGAGVFTIPGLLKIVRYRKPAQAAKKNVPNPFKPGEFRDIPAKPAQNKVKVRALKTLKEMV